MTENQTKKTSLRTLIMRALIPFILILGIVAGVYVLYTQDQQASERVMDEGVTLPVQQEAVRIEPPVLMPDVTEKEAPVSIEVKKADEKLEKEEENADQPVTVTPGKGLDKKGADPFASFSPVTLTPGPVVSDQNAKGLEKYVIFSDFVVRARTGLPFEGALLQLDRVIQQPQLKVQLRQLLPYALEGLGTWPVLMRDLDKVLDRGVHTKAKAVDPWVVRFIKSFFHVRKKSPYSMPLREALESRDWPEAFALTDKLIESGFGLRKWKGRLERYVQGHVLLSSFFVAHQSASSSDIT